MTWNIGRWERNLPYPLQDSGSDEVQEPTTPDATNQNTPFFPTDEPDELIDLHIRMSMSQFTAIASAIDVGRDIAYGERSFELWRVWTSALIGVIETMDCGDVADCVESELATNQTLINSVTTTINNNGFGNPNRVNPTLTKIADRNPADFNDTEVRELLDCNLDKLWGGIRHGIVERLDEKLADTLQDVAAIPTIIGKNAAWLDIIPVLGDLAEAVVTSLSSVTPTLLSLYESYSSEETKDELACELFDMVCSECRYPTFEEIYNHFKNYGMPETPEIGAWVLETMTSLLTNPVGVAAKVAYFTLMTWQLGILYLQASFNGATGTRAINRYAMLGEDFANDNWLELCDGCGESYMKYIWDFKVSNQDSYVTQNFSAIGGAWVSGTGWIETAISGSASFLSLGIAFDPTWKIRAIGIKTTEPASANASIVLRPTRGIATGQSGLALSWGSTGWTFFKNGLLSSTGWKEIAFTLNYSPASDAALEAVCVIFETGYHKSGSIPTASETLSGTVYP